MDMNYLRIFADQREVFESYTAEQRGNLLSAMMAYAFDGVDTAWERGAAESHVWPFIRKAIDDSRSKQELRSRAGEAGGNAKAEASSDVANESKPVAKASKRVANASKAVANPSKRSETASKKAQEQEQEQEQEHEHEQEQREAEGYGTCACAREGDPPATADNLIFDLDPEEMRRNAELEERVAQLIRRCLSPWSDVKQQRIMEDVGKYGIEKVEAALNESADKTRGANSLPFYRTFLTDKPKPAANKAGTQEGNYQHRQYTAADYAGMEVDLDKLCEEEEARPHAY